jgi:hypothetical protein
MKLIRELKTILESSPATGKYNPAAALCADFKTRLTMDECEKLISWVKGDADLTPALAKKVREVTRQEDLDEVGDEWFAQYVKVDEEVRFTGSFGRSVTKGMSEKDILKLATLGAASNLSLGLNDAKKVAMYAMGDLTDLPRNLEDALYDHYHHEMPYGVQKARDGTPEEWYAEYLLDDLVDSGQRHLDKKKQVKESGKAMPFAFDDAVRDVFQEIIDGELYISDVTSGPETEAEERAAEFLEDKYYEIARNKGLNINTDEDDIYDLIIKDLEKMLAGKKVTEGAGKAMPFAWEDIFSMIDNHLADRKSADYALEAAAEHFAIDMGHISVESAMAEIVEEAVKRKLKWANRLKKYNEFLDGLVEGEVSPRASMKVRGMKLIIGNPTNRAWVKKVSAALQKLKYGVEAQGPHDGSTSYAFIFPIDRHDTREMVITKLREVLDFDGYLEARYYDLANEGVVSEGAMKDLHTDLLNAIEDEFGTDDKLTARIADWLVDNKDDQGVDDFLYDHFADSGQMPYGTMKARTGDPKNWIADEMEKIFKKQLQPIWKAQAAKPSLKEFAPSKDFGGGEGDDDGFDKGLADMAHEQGFVKGASLVDGATLETGFGITKWDKMYGGLYKQYFAAGWKEGRENKLAHDIKTHGGSGKVLPTGAIKYRQK